MIKLSDYVVKFLENNNIKDVFMISGGLAIHLVDSIGRSKKINYYCNFHEQASAMAAEGYAKLKQNLAVCIVTGGPGGSNTITGVVGQWQDSVPVLYISGQVRADFLSKGTKLRQYGEQELNITEIIKPITKYAFLVTDPNTIRYHLEKAVYLATSERPGPVWIDIPLDVQNAKIDESKLTGFSDLELKKNNNTHDNLKKQISNVLKILKESNRPVILAGNGIRSSKAHKVFFKLVNRLKIPVLTASCANDLMYQSHKLYFGNPGLVGDRAANFVVQNSDLLLCIGTRLNLKTISFNYKSFARESKIIMVDIDKSELSKKTINPYLKIQSDANVFIQGLLSKTLNCKIKKFDKWISKCEEWKKKYPKLIPKYKENGDKYVNPYFFIHILSNFFKEGDIVVSCNGIASIATLLMSSLKKNQRMILNVGCGAMGYDLPAAIGACIANKKKNIMLTVGDGSIQFNIQELQTIVNYKLPIKIFVFNNNGYASIRNTQNNFFKGHYVASDKKSGVFCPDMKKIAKAYGISFIQINNHTDISNKIKKTLSVKGPVICNINMSYNAEILPRIGSVILPDGRMVSKPLEDMYPYLPSRELKKNMIIKPWSYDN